MWLTKLKIAVVEKNVKLLEELMSDIPEFDNIEDIKEASYLIQEAISRMNDLKDKTSDSMKQIKKNINFLRSMDIPTSKKLDIKS